MSVAVLAAMSGAAVATGTVTVLSAGKERADVRRSLRALAGYQVQGVRDQEMLAPFGQRVVGPLTEGFGRLVRRFTPDGYRERLARKVQLSGNPAGYEVDRLIVRKALGLISGVIWVPLVWGFLGMHTLIGLLLIGALWAGSFMHPDIQLDHVATKRRKEITRRLPDILDLLVISVEAGLGFEQALDRTASSVPGPLSDEFRRFLQETRLGSSRADALRALDERTEVPELRSFIMALLQADTFGVSISRILRNQADEMRIRRRIAAQELAQKAPVKMLFPLVICIFPAVFVIVLGPALITVLDAI
jgi:tight adherence protein C